MITLNKFRRSVAVAAAAALLASLQTPSQAEPPISGGNQSFVAPQAAPPEAVSPAPAPPQLELLVAAATSGNIDAMNDLAVLITIRAQGPGDYAMALDWYQRAIDGGSHKAMSNLGTMYLHGVGVPQDYVNAFHWFQRAAECGNVHGMYRAGAMAEAGLGTSRDPRLAQTMYRNAAESGFVPAMVKVSDEYALGSGTTADLVEAYAWLRVAKESGLSDGMEISVLAKLDALASRLGPQRRDEARKRVSQLIALVRDHGSAPVQDLAPSFGRGAGSSEAGRIMMETARPSVGDSPVVQQNGRTS